MTACRLLPVLLLALSACVHAHRPDNAPGNIDVHAPPRDIAAHEVEPPEDPGEQMMVYSLGAVGGGGVFFPQAENEEVDATWTVGPEVSVGYGTRSRSHNEDDFFVFPERSYGGSIGWTALTRAGEGVGPIYGEAYFHETLLTVAGGWAWDPNDQTHGPQITLSTLLLFVRATHLFDLGTQAIIGIQLELPYQVVWSQ